MGCGCVGKHQVGLPAAGPRPFLGTTDSDFVRELDPEELKDKKRLLAYFHLLRRSKCEGQFEVTDEFRSSVRKKGVPPRFRWRAWRALSGCTDLQRPGLYDRMIERPIDGKTLESIEKDLDRTFPKLEEFGPEQKRDLANMLRAFAGIFPQVGYCQGMNFVAGFLLLASIKEGKPVEDAFFMFLQVMLKYKGNLLFCEGLPLLKLRTFQFRLLVEKQFPEVHRHFEQNMITPELYATKWLLTAFTRNLDFEDAARVWDVIFCDGIQFSVLAALATVQLLRPRLLSSETEGIIELLALESTTSPPSGGDVVKAALKLRLPRKDKLDACLSKLQSTWEKDSPEDAEQLARASQTLVDEGGGLCLVSCLAMPAASKTSALAATAVGESLSLLGGDESAEQATVAASPHNVAAEARVDLNQSSPSFPPAASRPYDSSPSSTPQRDVESGLGSNSNVVGAPGRALRHLRPDSGNRYVATEGDTSAADGTTRGGATSSTAPAIISVGETAGIDGLYAAGKIYSALPFKYGVGAAQTSGDRLGVLPRSASGIQASGSPPTRTPVPDLGGPLPQLLHREDTDPPIPSQRSLPSSARSSQSVRGYDQPNDRQSTNHDPSGHNVAENHAAAQSGDWCMPRAIGASSSGSSLECASGASSGALSAAQRGMRANGGPGALKLPNLQGLAVSAAQSSSARDVAAPDSAARTGSVASTRPPSATTRPSSARLPTVPRLEAARSKEHVGDSSVGVDRSPTNSGGQGPYSSRLAPQSLGSTWADTNGGPNADSTLSSAAMASPPASNGKMLSPLGDARSKLLSSSLKAGAMSSMAAPAPSIEMPASMAWSSPRPSSAPPPAFSAPCVAATGDVGSANGMKHSSSAAMLRPATGSGAGASGVGADMGFGGRGVIKAQ